MNPFDTLVWAKEYELDTIPKWSKLKRHLERGPDDDFIQASLERAVENVKRDRANGDALSPHPDSTCGISDGDTPIAFQLKNNAPVRVNFGRLPGQRHSTVMSGVAGLPNSGKSTEGMAIARGVARLDRAVVWYCDPSGVAPMLLGTDIDKFCIVRFGKDFQLPPYDPSYLPEPVSDKQYLEAALNFAYATTELMAREYERHDSRFLQHEITKHYILKAAEHWRPGHRPLPSYSTIHEALNAPIPDSFSRLYKREKVKDYALSAQGVVDQINRLGSGVFDCSYSNVMQKLLSQNLIIDVSGVGAQEFTFFLLWLLEYFDRYATHHAWKVDSRLRVLLVLDDMQNLLFKQSRSPLVEKLTTLRQRGLHLCVMAHNFSSLAPIAKGNMDLICQVGPVASQEDFKMLTDFVGMNSHDESVKHYLSRIRQGEGFVRYLRGYARPIAVRYPLIRKQPVTESMLARRREEVFRDVRCDPPLTLADLETTPEIGKRKTAHDSADAVRKFLESIAQLDGWTKPQQEHLVNAGIGNSKEARERLLVDISAYVTRHPKVNAGRGGLVTLYELTAEGWEFLDRDPVPIPGKGDLPHKYYQHRTARAFSALSGWLAPKLEQRIGRHAYDFVLTTSTGMSIGGEIAASEKDKNEAANAMIGFLPNQSAIHTHIILAASEAAFARVSKDIEKCLPLKPVRARIFIERIGLVWADPKKYADKWLR